MKCGMMKISKNKFWHLPLTQFYNVQGTHSVVYFERMESDNVAYVFDSFKEEEYSVEASKLIPIDFHSVYWRMKNNKKTHTHHTFDGRTTMCGRKIPIDNAIRQEFYEYSCKRCCKILGLEDTELFSY